MKFQDIEKIAEMTKAFNATHKHEVQTYAYQHRFKHLIVSCIFCIVFSGVLIVAYWQKNKFSTINWYLLMILAGFILSFSFIMFINYIIIVVNKKPPSH